MIFKKKKMTMEEMLQKQLTCKHERYEIVDIQIEYDSIKNNGHKYINTIECRDCKKTGKIINEKIWEVKE